MSEGPGEIRPDETEERLGTLFDAIPDGLFVVEQGTGLILRANSAACEMHAYACSELSGRELITLIHPDSRREFARHIETLAERSPLRIGTRQVRADSSTFHAEWHVAPLRLEGRDCWLGVMRDVTERMDAEMTLLRHASARRREQTALLEMSQSLAATLEFRPGWILEQLRNVVEYSHAGFFALQGSSLVVIAMRGTVALEQSRPITLSAVGPDALGQLFTFARPIVIPDWQEDSGPARFLRSLLQPNAEVLLEGMRAWMWVPLAVRKRLIGGLGLAHAEYDFFTPAHAALALSVANQAAITMVNAELHQSAQTLAALQERQRLAQNLHDAVNQSLFSAGLIADVLPRIWDQGEDVARQSLDELGRLTRGAMAEMRALLAELRPDTLTDAELGDLLRLLANGFAGRTNIPAHVTVSGEGTLPADVQVALYRICQEAINNIGKHADAQQVIIDLHYEGRSVDLCISDDGRGFDPTAMASGHYGMTMMRERAEGIGARLTVTSKIGEGSEVRIRWPADPS